MAEISFCLILTGEEVVNALEVLTPVQPNAAKVKDTLIRIG